LQKPVDCSSTNSTGPTAWRIGAPKRRDLTIPEIEELHDVLDDPVPGRVGDRARPDFESFGALGERFRLRCIGIGTWRGRSRSSRWKGQAQDEARRRQRCPQL
jgi:hypothetical protein